jgi:hypothetical protein
MLRNKLWSSSSGNALFFAVSSIEKSDLWVKRNGNNIHRILSMFSGFH